MHKNPLEVQHWTADDFRSHPFDKVILPLGSLENHGWHMPYGTDALTAHTFALDIAARLPGTAVLPPVNYGMSHHYKDFPISASLVPETMTAIIRDILTSMWEHGIHKVLIFNGHDGNIAPIEIAARAVKVEHPEMRIIAMNDWWNLVGDMVPDDFFEVWKGSGHAGEAETSIGLEMFPELCKPELAAGVVPNLPPYLDIKWKFNELTNTGASGDPTRGTAAKGKEMRRVVVDTVVKLLLDLEQSGWDYRSDAVK